MIREITINGKKITEISYECYFKKNDFRKS